MYFSELQSVFHQCVKCIYPNDNHLYSPKVSPIPTFCSSDFIVFFLFLRFLAFFFPEDCVFLVFLYYCVSEQKAGAAEQ